MTNQGSYSSRIVTVADAQLALGRSPLNLPNPVKVMQFLAWLLVFVATRPFAGAAGVSLPAGGNEPRCRLVVISSAIGPPPEIRFDGITVQTNVTTSGGWHAQEFDVKCDPGDHTVSVMTDVPFAVAGKARGKVVRHYRPGSLSPSDGCVAVESLSGRVALRSNLQDFKAVAEWFHVSELLIHVAEIAIAVWSRGRAVNVRALIELAIRFSLIDAVFETTVRRLENLLEFLNSRLTVLATAHCAEAGGER